MQETEYNDGGQAHLRTDNAGMVTETEFDDLGRGIETTEDVGGLEPVTERVYDEGGRLHELIAVNAHVFFLMSVPPSGTRICWFFAVAKQRFHCVEKTFRGGLT